MKHAVITGSASGIGLDCCGDLLASGWHVFGLDRAHQSHMHPNFTPVPCDVSSAESVATAFEMIGAATSRLEALVCSAGILRTGALLGMTEADFDAVFAVNTRGPWLTARAALPLLERAARPGDPARIVMVASVSAIRPKVNGGAYAASKAALAQLTKVLSVELAAKGILVNAVAPATVNTPMVREATGGNGYKLSGVSPLGRVAEPSDVTAVIRFLLSSDANYLAGAILPIDGGTSAAFDPR